MIIEQKVWQTLSAIDVSGFVEKKQNLTYLSWAHAYAIFSQNFPAHDYSFTETERNDGTVMIECKLTIRDGDQVMERAGWLPCLDYRNKAISSPDAMQINTTRMRCLVKTLGLCGLGLNIYQGEDLPVAESLTKDNPISDKQVEMLNGLIESTGTDVEKFCKAYSVAQVTDLKSVQFEHALAMLHKKQAKQEAQGE